VDQPASLLVALPAVEVEVEVLQQQQQPLPRLPLQQLVAPEDPEDLALLIGVNVVEMAGQVPPVAFLEPLANTLTHGTRNVFKERKYFFEDEFSSLLFL